MNKEKDVETRALVLGYLAKRRLEAKKKQGVTRDVTREELLKKLGLDGGELDYHISYLAERFLVYIQTPMPHMPWTHVHITTNGAEYYERASA